MLFWETADQDPSLDPPMREFATLWQQLPKIVFSRALGPRVVFVRYQVVR